MAPTPSERIPVGILGATGMVGQRLVLLLADHPWFRVAWLAASERSSGVRYGDAVRWRMSAPLPAAAAALPVSTPDPDACPVRVVFAALDAAVADRLEPAFADAGKAVITNSSALRMRPDVPLVIPEINAGHLALLETQPSHRRCGGYVVANPNCSVIGLALALAPLHRAFGVAKVAVTTMQALSGAGHPGVAALDIQGNVIPYIANEEAKLEAECGKILGRYRTDGAAPGIEAAGFVVSAHCNRVAVEDGHTESVSVQLERRARPEDIERAWREFRGRPQELDLPLAPEFPLHLAAAPDRPQPRLDRDCGGGMSVVVGRLRPCPLFDYKFTVLVHNTMRGAAGAALLNAELLRAEGRL